MLGFTREEEEEKQVTHTQTHDKKNTTNDHRKNHPSHLTTIGNEDTLNIYKTNAIRTTEMLYVLTPRPQASGSAAEASTSYHPDSERERETRAR